MGRRRKSSAAEAPGSTNAPGTVKDTVASPSTPRAEGLPKPFSSGSRNDHDRLDERRMFAAEAHVELNPTTVRGICAEYFDSNVNPVLRYVQQAQDSLERQLKELRVVVEQKADSSNVPSLAEFQSLRQRARVADLPLASPRRPEDSGGGVATLVRLQELSAALSRKADVGNVPTLAQFKKLSAAMEQKPHAKDGPHKRADCITVAPSALEKLAAEIQQKADAKDVPTLQDVNALRDELLKVKATDCKAVAPEESQGDIKKMQLVVAAAGARFEKQLRDLRQQIKDLRVGIIADNHPGERWPGRVLDPPPHVVRPMSDDGMSDAGSITGSVVGSIAGSAFGPEERAELKKIQTVVAAAGTAFSRDMKEVRKQVQKLREEVFALSGGKEGCID